jgi:hypothetical protein
MDATIYVDGEGTWNEDVETVSVDVDDNGERAQWRCKHCGADLNEYPAQDGGGVTWQNEDGGAWAVDCPDAEEGKDGGFGPHEPARVPLSWVNHAAVTLNEGEDSVTVSISVGDPRGSFGFTIRRMPDTEDATYPGQLLLHTPYPGEPSPHMALKQLHDGTFLIG